ncbi:MAG: RHS repeat-associated core domain-containing protein [Chloroflexi bacterium]|nr:RHS repeat-associated core domain-containing protein [Chloroflexota bacterium]
MVQNVYDGQGRVAEQWDALGGVTCLYYGQGPTYTSAGCPGVSPAPGKNQTVVVDARGNRTTTTYDDASRAIAVQDALGGSVQYTYNTDHRLICITDQRGNRTAYGYDVRGNITQTIDALNTDAACGLKVGGVAWSVACTAQNDPDLATDPLGRQTDWAYDGTGNLTEILEKDEAGSVTRRTCFSRDSVGQVTARTESTTLLDCTGDTTRYEYDGYGNQTAVIDPRYSGEPTPPKTTLGYDLAGRLITATNELGHATTRSYDAQNHLLSVRDALGNTTRVTYDAKGNRRTVTDANGKVITHTYDLADRLIQVTDALNQTTVSGYDANGNLTSIANARGKVITATYDALNRVQTATDPLNRTTSYQYDGAGNLTQRTDARGLITRYTSDGLNRPTRLEHWNGQALVDAVDHTYDALGNRVGMVDATGSYTTTYTALNQVASAQAPGNRIVNSWWDTVGNRKRIFYTDPRSVGYEFDGGHRLITVTEMAAWGDRETVHSYDDAGKLTRITRPNGVWTEYSYDGADRLVGVTHRTVTSTLQSFSYVLDGVGNRTQMTNASGGVTLYQYDALYRLTQVTYPDASVVTYTYDPVGNRLSENGTTYTYDDADQLLIRSDGTIFGYAANGNQTLRGADLSTYDHENRLTQSTIGLGTNVSVYNGDGLRTRHTQGLLAITTDYIWDIVPRLPVVLQDGSRHYVYGLGLLAAIGDADGSPTYYLQDGLGSVTGLTDLSGNLVATYEYDVFGAVRSQTGQTSNYWLYTGQQRDIESGLYYLRARSYDPAIGRFLSRDPFPMRVWQPSSLNRYVYALNNPANLVDPTGLDAERGGSRFDDVAESLIQATDGVCAELQRLGIGQRDCASLRQGAAELRRAMEEASDVQPDQS